MRAKVFSSLVVLAGTGVALAMASAACAGAKQVSTVIARSDDTIRCVDVSKDERRTTYGCFNVAHVTGLRFKQPSVVWYLYRFTSEAAAKAGYSEHGTVVNEAGAFWLSVVAPTGAPPARYSGGVLAARVGPLGLPPAAEYTATLAYAVMKPGQRSRIHTHPGPEAFYVIAGSQCVETPSGSKRASAGDSFTEPAGVPMELMATGTTVRQGFALVLHDATQRQAALSTWRPTNLCASQAPGL